MQYQKRAPLNRRGQLLACFVLGMVLLTCLTAWSAENDTSTGVLRSRVYKFNHITSQQAQEIFSQLGIGQKYNALTPEVLIVTSNTGTDLVRAMEVKNVIDQEKPVQVRVLTTGSASEPLPPLDAFSAGLTSVTVGTMSDAPPREAFRPVIVDVLDNQLIAIATEEILNEVAQALDKWKTEHPAAEKQAPEAGMNTPAEKPAEKPDEKPAVVEPNQPPTPAVETAAEREIPEKAPEAQVQEVPLEQVAEQLSGELMVADANESASEPMEEGGDDDFMVNELIDALDQAQQDQPVTEVAETVPQDVAEKSTEDVPDAVTDVVEQKSEDIPLAVDDAPAPTGTSKTRQMTAAEQAAAEQAEADRRQQELMEKLKALMGQSQQEQAAETPTEDTAAKTVPKTSGEDMVEDATDTAEQATGSDAAETKKTEPAGGPDPIEAELKMLREKLTALEAEAAERPQQTTDVKIQTAEGDKKIVTKPTIETGLAEEELETVMDLPQEVELESLIDLVGKQLGLNYMYDPVILKNQKVQLKVHGGRIKVKDVYSLLESVLKLKGFVMTRENQLVTIVKAADADQAITQVDPVIRTPGEPIQAGNVIVSTLFTLDNISTETAKNMLMSLKLGMTNGFQEIPETGTLLVTDYAFRMGRIEEVLSIIDVPGEKKEYKFRTLKYMSPSELVPKLQELAGQLEDVSLQITTQAAATPQRTRTVRTRNPKTGQIETKQVPITPPGGSTPSQQKPESPDSVYIDTDDRTNRILMAGKPDQISLVNELIDALDIPQYDLKYVREYIIENVEAQDVVDVINELGLASVSVTTDTSMTTTRGRTTTPPLTPPRPVTPPQSTTAATQPGQADQPYVSIRSATNSLLVNATAEQHEAIELAIAHVDVVQKDQRTIRQYEIQYVDAQEVIDTLVDLQIIAQDTASTYDPYSRSNSRSSRSSRQPTSSRTNQPQPMFQQEPAAAVSLPTAEGGSEKEITADQPQISVLETTNSLLVFATPKQHDAIALVIGYTDQEITTKTTPYVVYALENQDPVELADVLTKLIQETVEESGKTSTPESKIQTRPAGDSTVAGVIPTLEEEKIRIIADEMSYSLIVYANKRNQQWIAELIDELDEYRPQVLLDCTLVQVTRDDEFQYSVDLVAKTYGGTELQSGTPIIPKSSNATNPFSVSQLADASSVGGTLTGFFNSEMIQGLLTAMQKDGFGRVMSQPKVLVNDNQEGTIKTENITSIAQQKSIVQPGSDLGNTITTTDVSFVEYTSGVTLTIKPHISKGDMLRLEISLNRTDFDNEGTSVEVAGNEYPQPPDLLSADITTVATVPDGTTIILGGLESVDQGKTNQKVPILGDIPLIGTLFRDVSNKDQLSKLYVFVKANIIRPSDQVEGLEDIRRVSKKYRDEFENIEAEFQGLQDFPGINPPPMEPVRVLDDDEFASETPDS